MGNVPDALNEQCVNRATEAIELINKLRTASRISSRINKMGVINHLKNVEAMSGLKPGEIDTIHNLTQFIEESYERDPKYHGPLIAGMELENLADELTRNALIDFKNCECKGG